MLENSEPFIHMVPIMVNGFGRSNMDLRTGAGA